MVLWMVPAIRWCTHGTVISFRDILLTASRPLLSSMVAGGVAFGVRLVYGELLAPLSRLVVETTILLVVFLGMLLFATGQRSFYLGLLRGLKGSSSKDKSLASA
jgi:hypothetical protein